MKPIPTTVATKTAAERKRFGPAAYCPLTMRGTCHSAQTRLLTRTGLGTSASMSRVRR